MQHQGIEAFNSEISIGVPVIKREWLPVGGLQGINAQIGEWR
jgi:hypothetical protein